MDKQNINPNIFPKIDLLPHPLRRVGGAIIGFFQMHQLSEQSDHKFDHPFDAELYDKQEQTMQDYWQSVIGPTCVDETAEVVWHTPSA